MPNSEKVVIIGSGAAAYTAAIYAARADLRPLLFGGVAMGGQLMITSDVENFPGFPEAILGPELMERMRKQCERLGVRIVQELVSRVDFSKRPFQLESTEGTKASAESVIVATGANAKLLGLPAEKRLMGHGVSACATCDGFFFKNQHIAVVGGGDSAMEEATFLTRFAESVTIVHRREDFRASPIMLERAQNDPKIRWATNAAITGVEGENKVEALQLTDTVTGEQRTMPATGLFLAIGHDPRSDLFRNAVTVDDEGYVLVGSKLPGSEATVAGTATSIEGVFACGDLVDHTYRQAITAAGTGCQSALDAERYLAALADRPEPASAGAGH